MPVRIFVCAAFVMISAMPVVAATDRDWDECEDNRNPNTVDRSIAACTRILSGNETSRRRAMALVNRCGGWSVKSDHDRAIADCNEAVRLAPTYAPPYINRGLARDAKGDRDGAIADYSEAIRLEPKDHAGYIMRGIAWWSKGENDRAIADFDEVIRRGADLDLAYQNRGMVWHIKGDFDRAIADYDQAIRIAPNDPVSYHGRGLVWSAKNQLDRAIADYTQAIQLDGNHIDSYTQRGYAHFSRLEFTPAARDLLRSSQSPKGFSLVPALFRYVAQARAGENALGELESNAARLTSATWPYPAIEFFLGRRSAEAMLKAAPFGYRCAAEFFIGQSHLLRGERQQAQSRFLNTVDGCAVTTIEYRAAAAELKRMKP